MADLDKELIGSFQSLYDLATRIDERVKNLINRADIHDEKFDEILDTQKDIEGRLRVLESKAEEIREKTLEFMSDFMNLRILYAQDTLINNGLKIISENREEVILVVGSSE